MASPLPRLIAAVAGHPDEQNRLSLYSALKSMDIYIATTTLPASALSLSGLAAPSVDMPLVMAQTPQGNMALMAFCDVEDVKTAGKELFPIRMNVGDVMRVVTAHAYEALVLRCGALWVGIPREDSHLLME